MELGCCRYQTALASGASHSVARKFRAHLLRWIRTRARRRVDAYPALQWHAGPNSHAGRSVAQGGGWCVHSHDTAAVFVDRRPANRHWRRLVHREKAPETPFRGLHIQIWGPTRVEHHLLEDMIRVGGKKTDCGLAVELKDSRRLVGLVGGQILSQQSQQADEEVRHYRHLALWVYSAVLLIVAGCCADG